MTFAVGIGVNTGIARVGNIGSRLKFKYGVLGNIVNIGSRLQDATKQLGVDCVAADATVQACNRREQIRRLAVLSVVGIDRAIEGQEIKAAIGCWADHNAVGIVGEMAQGRAQMIHRELGAVRPNDDRRLPSGLRLDGPDGALESLSKGPACLFDLLRARGQVERRWCRHSAITSSRTPCGENRFQALLVEPPLGTLQPRG